MKTLPASLFSMPLSLLPDGISSKLPKRIAEGFNLKAARLGEGQEFLAAVAISRPTMLSSRSLVRTVAKVDSRRVVIFYPYMDSGMMRALASEGISYVRDSENVFLPFLGMAASPVPEARSPRPLSPHAQRIVLNLISGRWDGLTAGELAEAAGVSRSTITNCLVEIEAILPSALFTDWKKRILRNPGLSKEEMLEAFEPYLVSPVKNRKLLKGQDALESLIHSGALLAGESALAFYSDLAHDSSIVRLALYRKRLAEAEKEARGDWVEAKWFEEPDIVVEEWAYEIDGANELSYAATGFGSLEALELYVEMKDSGDDDVRLGDAIAQLREEACR